MKRLLTPLILGLTLITHLGAASKVLPVLNSPMADLSKDSNAASHSIDLSTAFGTEAIDDQVVRFTSQTSNGSRIMDFALFSTRTPGTRTNFLKYVADGDYNNSFIHRSMPGFVIQGGGFYDTTPGAGFSLGNVPTDDPITNEFGVSNTEGTVSMAKLGGDPDSATSQWFVSLGANSDNLDHQNGGFTVFGRVTKSTFSSAEDFGNTTLFPVWNAGGAFSNLPLNASFDNSASITDTDLILFPSVTLATLTEGDAGESTTLSYSVTVEGAPTVVNPSIIGGNQLQLNYPAHTSGSNTLKITATDSVGNTVVDTFTVTVLQTYTAWRHNHFPEADASNDSISGPEVDSNNDGLTNLELFVHGLSQGETHIEPVIFSVTTVADNQHPSFTFPMVNNTSGITFQLQKSDDLGNEDAWSPIPHTEISRSSVNLIDTIQIRSTNAADTDCFYRLVFTLTE